MESESDVRIPASALAALAEGGSALGGRGISLVREVGRMAGERIVREAPDPDRVTPEEFWDGLASTMRARGLGVPEYRIRDRSLSEILLADSPEAVAVGNVERKRMGCPFATGLLGRILSWAASEAVPILEVECRARGAERCRFLLGPHERLSDIRGRLREGASLAEAVEGS